MRRNLWTKISRTLSVAFKRSYQGLSTDQKAVRRTKARDELRTTRLHIVSGAIFAARLLLDETRDSVKQSRDVNRIIETKATGVVTLAVASLAFCAAFRQGQLFTTPFTIGLVFFALTAIGAGVWTGAPVPIAPPFAPDYNLAETLHEANAEARITVELIDQWDDYLAALGSVSQQRQARLNVAYSLLAFTLIFAFAELSAFMIWVSPPSPTVFVILPTPRPAPTRIPSFASSPRPSKTPSPVPGAIRVPKTPSPKLKTI